MKGRLKHPAQSSRVSMCNAIKHRKEIPGFQGIETRRRRRSAHRDQCQGESCCGHHCLP